MSEQMNELKESFVQLCFLNNIFHILLFNCECVCMCLIIILFQLQQQQQQQER
jgi:hypothetical protein